MASSGTYKNKHIQSETEKFINNEFCPDNNIPSYQIIRVVDYKRNTEYDKLGSVEFYIDAFICFIQNNEYHIHHYCGDFHYKNDKKFEFIFCKLVKFPFIEYGKIQVDIFFANINRQYDNKDFLI
jgi:hypothetical protein